MADAAVVSTKLEQIEQYHGELREKRDVSKTRFLDDVTERRATERMFENVIQACIDLAKHIATENFGLTDAGSREALSVLATHDVISDETASTLSDAVGFRNLLAHEYGTIDPEQVYEYLQTELGVYNTFSRQVASWFDSVE